MKYILLLIGIVFFAETYSQNYVPFAESGVKWRVDKTSCVYCTADFVTCLCSKYQYTLYGDTTVGNFTYKKIHRGWEDFDEFEPTDSGYLGALRQDIPNKRVYYLIPNTTIDTLLYDYNLSLGTILPTTFVYEQSNATVTDIDSILIGINYHKVYQIGNIGQSLIEGIGSTAGLIEMINQFEINYQLKCYSLESGYQHVFDGSNDCDIITSILKKDIINSEIILPNPFNESSFLNFDCEPKKKYQIRIYNNKGEEIKTILFICENKPYSVQLKKEDFLAGIYYYNINAENNVVYKGKFIVQ